MHRDPHRRLDGGRKEEGMSLYKRGGVYHSYVWQNGVRYHKSTGTANRQKAQLIDQRFKEELNLQRHHIVQPVPGMRFSELAARFIAEGSPRPYHLDRLKLLLPFFGDTAIGGIHKSLVREYRTRRHHERNITDSTINRDIEALRHMLYWAVDEGLLLQNPLARTRMEQERRKPRIILSVEEEDKLLQAAPLHLRSIIKTALDTGMRRGELLAQRWEHVDFSRRLILVTHSKTAGGEGRPIPLTDRVFYDFRFRRKPEGLVFTFNKQAIARIKTTWKATLRRAGLRSIRFHDLRHTFNTRLLEAGVMQEVRKALMGHSTGEEVNAIYTHVELPMLRDAIAKLQAWTAEQRAQLKKAEQVKGENTSDGTSNLQLDQAGDSRESESGNQ
jgi:integrase